MIEQHFNALRGLVAGCYGELSENSDAAAKWIGHRTRGTYHRSDEQTSPGRRMAASQDSLEIRALDVGGMFQMGFCRSRAQMATRTSEI